jgi:hypothetical protein
MASLFASCCHKNKVTAEMSEKVGGEELTEEQIQNLDSELHPEKLGMDRNALVNHEKKRLETFKNNLHVFQATHGEEALSEK